MLLRYFGMLIFLLFVFAVGEAVDGGGFDCPACDAQENICVTDLHPEDCPPGTVYEEHISVCGCCPGCVNYIYLDVGAPCDSTPTTVWQHSASKGVIPLNIEQCRPGLLCDETTKMCSVGDSGCWIDAANEKLHWKPVCLENGDYAPRQCKGDKTSGRCFCMNKDGERIFGQMWAAEAENMTCACSRKVAEMLLLNKTDVSFHCSEDGNYEPLQCYNGLCYCANPKTGIAVSEILPEQLWTQLPCYNEESFGNGYLRICDSIYVSQQRISLLLKSSGVQNIKFGSPSCDPDGSYGAIQCMDGSCYCRTPENKPFEPAYQAEATLFDQMNCNCARDTLWFESHGATQVQNCKPNGNYEEKQSLGGGQTYCVDEDGFTTNKLC